MIHTTCSRSSSFNLPTCFLTPSFQTNPLLISPSFTSSCCCCCCCVNNPPIYNSFPRTKSINPSFLCNGLRRSTLIQFSPTKRLIFHGRRRLNSNRSSGFCLDSDGSHYYEKVYSFERRRPGVRKGRYACWGVENERKEQIFSSDLDDDFVDDGENLLDLMNCEKVVTLERRKQGGARKGRYACWGVENKKKEQIFSNEFDDDCVDDVENLLDLLNEEVGLDYLGVKERKRIEITDSSSVKRDSKSVHRVAEARSRREEDGRRVRNEGREEARVNRECRKEGSSCSSYYSVSSRSEFESDNDVETKQDGGFVKSSNECKDDWKQVEESKILKRNSAEKYYGNQEWRKKSEKKLNIESSQHESHLNTDRNRQQDSEIVNEMRRSKGSRVNSQKISDTHVKDEHRRQSNVIQETSTEVSGRVEDRRQEEHQRMDQMMISKGSRVNLQKISDTHIEDEYRRQSNVISEASSSSLREARMKNWEERSTEVSGRVEDRRQEEHERTDQVMISKGSRVNLQRNSDTHVKDEYRRQSNVISEASSSSALLKNWEEKTTEVSGRVEDRRQEEHERTNQMMISKGSRVNLQKDSDTHVKDEYRRQSNVISEASSSLLLESRMKKNWEERSTEVSGRVEDRRQEEQQKMDQMMISQGSRVNSQKDSDTRVKDEHRRQLNVISEGSSSSLRGRVEDRRQEEQQRMDQVMISQGSRVNSRKDSDTRAKDEYRRQSNVISEASSSSLHGRVEDRRQEEQQRMDQVMISQGSRVNSRKDSDTRVKDEYKRQSKMVSEASSSSLLEARMKNREETLTEVSGRVEVRRSEHQRTDQMMISKGSRAKSEKTSDTRVTDTKNSQVSGKESERGNQESHFESSTSAEKASMAEQVKFSSEETMKTGRRTTKASSFNVGMPRESFTPYKALRLIPEPSVQETAARDSGENRSNPTVSPSQVQDSEPEGFEPVPSGDAIASADEQQKLSSQFVGEFVNKAKNELSEAQSEKPKPHEEDELYEDAEQHELKSSGRGPSDEMWHETGNGEPVKKSGRSLWNVIGDVVRLRWASPRSEAHTPKSGGGKALSNQSTGSDAWFSGSGHEPEPEDYNEESTDTKTTKGQSRSKKDVSAPSSSTSPLPLPGIRMRRSPAVKGDLETGETDAPSDRGKMVIVDQPVSETYSKDGEVKRRKLGRMDQVSKDRFDEWEEAYTVETEQRRTDEFFMREALSEAKKAADFWEVPVGAVLVQDGKVIARGYNLVEELRDSTAHAEMICIREASNYLRSWRLSGTTLYVTLEPCPMCAGAILQARVDTVVWGAPNKLLGADGSWIRLFPDGDGDGGGNGSDKPGPPVHPFHPNMTVRRGVLSSECADAMQQFFQLRRKKKEKRSEGEPPPPPSPPSSSCLPITHHHHHPKLFSKMHDVFSIMFCL